MSVILIQCLGAVGLAILAVLAVRRALVKKQLDSYKDAVDIYFLIIGTIYAVILAFMLATVWEKYDQVSTMSEREANYLMDVYRLAEGMSEPDSSRIKSAAYEYAIKVTEDEWPLMASGSMQFGESDSGDHLWKAVTTAQPTSKHDELLLRELLSRFTTMTECRRIRIFRSTEGLPLLLWVILELGAIFIVGLSFLIQLRSIRMHSFLVGILSLVIVLVLLVTQDLSTPFDGVMGLEPYGFKQTKLRMERLSESERQNDQNRQNTEGSSP
jgi:hypothetical protein